MKYLSGYVFTFLSLMSTTALSILWRTQHIVWSFTFSSACSPCFNCETIFVLEFKMQYFRYHLKLGFGNPFQEYLSWWHRNCPHRWKPLLYTDDGAGYLKQTAIAHHLTNPWLLQMQHEALSLTSSHLWIFRFICGCGQPDGMLSWCQDAF